MRLPVFACAGNAFALVDEAALPADPGSFARTLCARGFKGERLDGVLAARPGRMTVYNADGSRPEACGDGLLCVAAHLAGETERELRIETDSGVRSAHVRPTGAGKWLVRATLGPAHVVEAGIELDVPESPGGTVEATLVDVGNPHCVLFVDELSDALVAGLGPLLERHERFPQHTNVEFVQPADGALRARVWERGVGETEACGTGACALATAAVESGRAVFPVRVDYPGGPLLVGRAAGPGTDVWMEGAVRYQGELEA